MFYINNRRMSTEYFQSSLNHMKKASMVLESSEKFQQYSIFKSVTSSQFHQSPISAFQSRYSNPVSRDSPPAVSAILPFSMFVLLKCKANQIKWHLIITTELVAYIVIVAVMQPVHASNSTCKDIQLSLIMKMCFSIAYLNVL